MDGKAKAAEDSRAPRRWREGFDGMDLAPAFGVREACFRFSSFAPLSVLKSAVKPEHSKRFARFAPLPARWQCGTLAQ